MTRFHVFLDLDGTLIRTYYNWNRLARFPDILARSRLIPHALVVPRPGIVEFLDGLNSSADVILFTAAGKDYADAVIGSLELGSHFAAIHSSSEEQPGSLASTYDLDDWCLVEDTPFDSDLTRHKMLCLGSRDIDRVVMVPTYEPHLYGDDQELTMALQAIMARH